MAATYRALAQRAQRRQHARSAAHERLRNRLTGGVIIALLIVAAVWGAGGGLSGLPAATRLRKIGTTPGGRPVYAP
jgi:hypothetical protein